MSARAARILTAALLALAMLAAAATVASARIHRLVLPPPERLPSALSVDEREWTVIPSRRVVAAGEVTLLVYNRGMDDHDLALVDSAGVQHRVDLGPGQSGTITATLTPGRYKIWCTLFAGTPSSHELLGMASEIEVRPQIDDAAYEREIELLLGRAV